MKNRGQVQLGITALVSVAATVATCMVFYFTQLIGLCTGIERNATKIEAVQQVQVEQRDTLKEIQTDIKELLKASDK